MKGNDGKGNETGYSTLESSRICRRPGKISHVRSSHEQVGICKQLTREVQTTSRKDKFIHMSQFTKMPL